MIEKDILLVEDEEVIRTLCARLIGDASHRLTVAATVEEGLSRVRASAPDLLITDLRLPDGDGMDVIRELRRLSNAARVIVITGSPTPEHRFAGDASVRIDEFISKPFEVSDLLSAIKRALAEESARP